MVTCILLYKYYLSTLYKMAEYTTIKISPEIWKLINQERSHNETMNEVLQRILSDRQKLKDMLMRSSSRIDLK